MKIALQISHTFGLDRDKDVVRRVLATHYRADGSGSSGPSWLSLIAQSKDSLWSVDLFRCESMQTMPSRSAAGWNEPHYAGLRPPEWQ